MIADQREAFRDCAADRCAGDGYIAEGTLIVLPIRSFGRRLAAGITGIARVELPAAIRTEAVDAVEIERRRAEILDGGRIRFLVAERGKIERDVMVDELAEIGEAGGDLGVVVRQDRQDWRPSSPAQVPSVDRRRRRAVQVRKHLVRTFRDRRARKANREIVESVGGHLCRGQAGHSLVLPSLPPIGKCWEKRGTGVSRCQVIKGSGEFDRYPSEGFRS